jgi:hypothetical protein
MTWTRALCPLLHAEAEQVPEVGHGLRAEQGHGERDVDSEVDPAGQRPAPTARRSGGRGERVGHALSFTGTPPGPHEYAYSFPGGPAMRPYPEPWTRAGPACSNTGRISVPAPSGSFRWTAPTPAGPSYVSLTVAGRN